MSSAERVKRHREAKAADGLSRVEVRARREDAALLRRMASLLAERRLDRSAVERLVTQRDPDAEGAVFREETWLEGLARLRAEAVLPIDDPLSGYERDRSPDPLFGN